MTPLSDARHAMTKIIVRSEGLSVQGVAAEAAGVRTTTRTAWSTIVYRLLFTDRRTIASKGVAAGSADVPGILVWFAANRVV